MNLELLETRQLLASAVGATDVSDDECPSCACNCTAVFAEKAELSSSDQPHEPTTWDVTKDWAGEVFLGNAEAAWGHFLGMSSLQIGVMVGNGVAGAAITTFYLLKRHSMFDVKTLAMSAGFSFLGVSVSTTILQPASDLAFKEAIAESLAGQAMGAGAALVLNIPGVLWTVKKGYHGGKYSVQWTSGSIEGCAKAVEDWARKTAYSFKPPVKVVTKALTGGSPDGSAGHSYLGNPSEVPDPVYGNPSEVLSDPVDGPPIWGGTLGTFGDVK